MSMWRTLTCVLICVMCETFQDNAKSVLIIRSSPPTATDGEPFTLICSISSGPVVAMAWLLNNTSKVITQRSHNCTKQPPSMGNNNINRFSVSCNNSVHSIQFIFNSSTDKGGWQCGKSVSDTDISPRSNTYSIDVTNPFTSTRSTLSSSATTETTSEPGTLTPQKGVTSPVMSTPVSPTATLYTETTSEPWTVTPQKVSTDEKNSNTIYIVVGTIGGAAVLLAVVVAAIVCIGRRGQTAHKKEEMKGERNVTGAQVYQNPSCDMVENELYRRSSDVSPIYEADNQNDDFIFSDAYASVDMPAASTCTPREQGASNDVDVDSLYAKPDKSRPPNVQQVSDIYAEVKKPKKKLQGDPKASEGDVDAKPNKVSWA